MLHREVHILFDELADTIADGTRKEYMESVATVPLLILDDFGMRNSHTLPPRICWKSSCAATSGSARLLDHGHVLKCGPCNWWTKTAAAT